MKKVLFVATVVKAHINTFHIPYLEWFKKSGYEVHVCAKNDYNKEENCNIPFCDKFYDLPFERSPLKLNNIKTYHNLKKIINSNDYDIIHCHTPMGGVLTRLAAQNARKRNTEVIYTAHGFHFFKGSSIINWLTYYPVEFWLSRYTDLLITINKEDFKTSRKFKAKKIEYIPGVGIDTTEFKKKSIDEKKKRKEININENQFMILSVGELNKNKNHEVIIRAIATLNNNNIVYVLCGEGPKEKELRDLAEHLGISKNVIFLGFRNDIPELCKIANLFAFPSYREGLSLSLMEAMASGLPVICSDIRGNKDLINDGINGYLSNPRDVNGFANSIDKIMNNKVISKSMIKENKTTIEKYGIDNVLNTYIQIIENSGTRRFI
ncbi:glycosyltransferase family 4 protein [Salinicoccus sp. RF5]|uniref:glycosyltransferase family 4 protein n=1 Tax=Salinicoccus sp. RF5 TaxID=2748874 RepID=UPI001E2C7E48|nr:glycosyltransferase family 4 protein [Salinicoccus sp. RF5]MCC4722358.1 glycosyltransferase family 4 protein [Salinicoccus sp. RF5]